MTLGSQIQSIGNPKVRYYSPKGNKSHVRTDDEIRDERPLGQEQKAQGNVKGRATVESVNKVEIHLYEFLAEVDVGARVFGHSKHSNLN